MLRFPKKRRYPSPHSLSPHPLLFILHFAPPQRALASECVPLSDLVSTRDDIPTPPLAVGPRSPHCARRPRVLIQWCPALAARGNGNGEIDCLDTPTSHPNPQPSLGGISSDPNSIPTWYRLPICIKNGSFDDPSRPLPADLVSGRRFVESRMLIYVQPVHILSPLPSAPLRVSTCIHFSS